MSDFYTDVIEKRNSLFASKARIASLDLLEPHVRAKVLAIVADAEANALGPDGI